MNPDVAYEEGSIVQVPRNSLEDLINDKVQKTEQLEQPEQIELLEQSDQLEEVKPVTIEITNKKAVLRHVKPQESKYWHFKFSDPRYTNQMTNVLQNIQGYRLTVEYGVPINTPDITLKMNGEIVGKIHLLLCDKRDANLPNKYYCKLYFYNFKSPQLFQAVKTALVNFFENFKVSQKPSLRPIKRRSLTKRRSLAKRSMAKRTSLTKRRRRPVK